MYGFKKPTRKLPQNNLQEHEIKPGSFYRMSEGPPKPNAPIDCPAIPKKRSVKVGLSVREISLDLLHKKFLNVLFREANHLLVQSKAGKLDKDAASALANYLRLMRTLKSMDDAETEGFSDEQLAEIANRDKVEES